VVVDASVVIDAVADPGPRGVAARKALADLPAAEALLAPGHLAFELLSGMRAAANRPSHPLRPEAITIALQTAEELGITIEAIPWEDVRRAWVLSQGSLRYADALYVAAAERHRTHLLTADARISRAAAAIECGVVTVAPPRSAR